MSVTFPNLIYFLFLSNLRMLLCFHFKYFFKKKDNHPAMSNLGLKLLLSLTPSHHSWCKRMFSCYLYPLSNWKYHSNKEGPYSIQCFVWPRSAAPPILLAHGLIMFANIYKNMAPPFHLSLLTLCRKLLKANMKKNTIKSLVSLNPFGLESTWTSI